MRPWSHFALCHFGSLGLCTPQAGRTSSVHPQGHLEMPCFSFFLISMCLAPSGPSATGRDLVKRGHEAESCESGVGDEAEPGGRGLLRSLTAAPWPPQVSSLIW